MASNNRDYEILLKMRADMAAGIAALQKVQGELRKTSDAAGAAAGAGAKINASLDSIRSRAAAVGASLKRMAGALVAAFAVREIANFVQSVIDADAKLGDMSKKVGVSTETLSALGQVARRNGTDIDAMQGAFVRLAKAATDSSSTGAKALQAMGIPLKQFLALKPADQFDLVAQKFAGYEDGARKAALATALFGKSGADLIPTLDQVGQQGVQALTDAAIANGTAVGGNAVEAAQKFQSALQTLKDKLAGAANQGLAQFTPQIEQLSNLLNNPDFQKSLSLVAEGIAAIGHSAISELAALNSFIGAARQILDFKLGGPISGDASNAVALSELHALQEEAARRAKPGINLNSRSLTLGFFDDTQTQSDSKLRARIAQLTKETTAYAKSREAANKADAEAKKNADTRGLFVGLGSGKGQAPIVANGASTGNDAAAKLARDAAAAQQQLTQSLIALQGQLDPTAAIYAKYNDAVQKATDQAELAKKATGANAQAIDTQRDAVIALAAQVRDAALGQLAEKDRQAWEALKRSFETPAQVAVDDALKRIQQLNDLLKKGAITAQQYHDSLAQIGAKSVTDAPKYQGPDAVVGGAFGELQKNSTALADLEAWHQSVLAANASFHAKDEAEEEAYQSRMRTIQQTYATQRVEIEKARGMLTLQASEEAFGQLAALTSSNNQTLAAIGRAAAVTQAALSLAINVAKASEVGFPVNVGFIAGAIAQGAQIVSLIDQAGAGSGGYSEGGYTGPGDKHQPAGIVHAGEVVFSQKDVARFGGVVAVESARLRGYASGGVVAGPSDFINVPNPADLGLAASETSRLDIRDLVSTTTKAGAARPQDVKVAIFLDKEELANEIMNSRTSERLIVKTVGDNPMSIKAKWR